MTTTPTTTKSKSKKPLPVKFEDDSILGAPIQDEILKRIGEQAKDWEETPRKPRSESAVATARTAERSAAATAKVKSASTRAWVIVSLLALVAALGGTAFWLNTRLVAVEHSLADSHTIVQAITGQMIELQKSQDESAAQLQSMKDAFAAAATAKAAVKAAVMKPAAPAPGAQIPAVKTK